VKLFAPYASRLEAFVDANRINTQLDTVAQDFDGPEPYAALREMVPVEDLRASGVFFTGHELAQQLWEPALDGLSQRSIIVDPACGAGDLLLAPAARLATLNGSDGISRQIRGADLEDAFLRAARARLRLQHSRGELVEGFENFEVRDFLSDASGIRDATHVVMNPPFFHTIAPQDCAWAAGRVNSAALFVMQAIRSMKPGSRLLAILPDVLRSGSHYEKWRAEVAASGTFARVEALGQFDPATDVHVFILDMVMAHSTAETAANAEWPTPPRSTSNISSRFEVRVGPVVPHRDPEDGAEAPYLTTKNIHDQDVQPEVRKYSKRLYAGPMVLVSRTSRPGQSPRARATVWTSTVPSSVENHLIVIKPLDGTLDSCHRLAAVLNDQRTTNFLDHRIRCRHLTVSAINEIPWIAVEG
jgi:hypothetical protein